ncbi:MAG: MBL fold metallo-hydrolase [Elusimicrobiota bacterium]|nr:MBL fold metallo-hydrolase [Elusimicrobiota bacterium]
MQIKTIVVGELETNCYFVIDEKAKDCFVIDPGAEGKKIVNELQQNSLNLTGIILTHAHPDHISAIPYLKEKFSPLRPKIYIHSFELDQLKLIITTGFYMQMLDLQLFLKNDFISPKLDVLLKDNDIISNTDETIRLKVLYTPGHTPGSICLVGDEFVFTGDTLFCGSVGRWDLPGGDEAKLMNSLKKLIKLPKNYLIYPGHGPQCSISGELKHNMFVREVMMEEN